MLALPRVSTFLTKSISNKYYKIFKPCEVVWIGYGETTFSLLYRIINVMVYK